MAKRNRRTGAPQFFGANRRLPRPLDSSTVMFDRRAQYNPFTDIAPGVKQPAVDEYFYSRGRDATGFSLTSTPAPLTKRLSGRGTRFPSFQVVAPPGARFCFNRKIRREVLFALNVAGGRGIGKRGVYRRKSSSYRC